MKKRAFPLTILLLAISLSSCAGNQQPPTQSAVQNDASIQSEPSNDEFEIKATNFSPDTSSMPDIMPYFEAALHDDVDAQFIVSLLYLDKIKVDNIIEGKLSSQNADMHLEHSRWRMILDRSDYLLTDLAHNPSLSYIPAEFTHCSQNQCKPALDWLETAAAHGYKNAEFILGMLYFNGVAVDKDQTKGTDLIYRAAVHGLPNAMYEVGMMHELGINTAVDKTKAMKWLNKAAENGSIDAKFILGMKHLDGIDAPVNIDTAKTYFAQSKDYHIWSLLFDYPGNFSRVCQIDYDKADNSWAYEDGCGGENFEYDENLSEEENLKAEEAYLLNLRSQNTIDYGVDYDTARSWLENAAQNPKNTNAMMLRAQTIYLDGCKGGLDSQDKSKKAEDLVLRAAQNHPEITDFMLGSFYHHELNQHTDTEPGAQMAAKSIHHYTLAADAGNADACGILANYYDESQNTIPSYPEHPFNLYKAYEYRLKQEKLNHFDNYMSSLDALNIATKILDGGNPDNTNSTQPDPKEAVTWLEKSIIQDESVSLTTGSIFLGDIYAEGKIKPKNEDKAAEYYEIFLNDSSRATEYDQTKALKAASWRVSYYSGNHKTEKILRWNQFISEACMKSQINHSDSQICKSTSEYRRACNAVEQSKKITDLQQAVESEIKKEQGKKIDQFFVIKDILKPAIQESFNFNPIPFYNESVQKALRGITALVIAQKGSADLELIKNTFYYLAIYLSNKPEYIDQLKKMSPVSKKILSTTELSNYQINHIFQTWYLRQIPYAAEDIFNQNKGKKTWNSMLSEADKAIESNEALKTTFGYHTTDIIQTNLKP